MKFDVREEGEVHRVEFEGHIDLEWSGAVRDVLLDSLARGNEVRVDLARVDIIDSSGISALLDGFQYARKMGKRFILCRVGAPVMRVFKLARLDTVFVIDNT